jgi:catechol 2,3-dioxygenase-like lactoylglutathione lyase family enzyme/ribosomal protein S18 acetylase RimI-like enzyme
VKSNNSLETQLIVTEIFQNKSEICERIIRALPQWFGIESAILDYAKDVESMPMLIATIDSEVVGFLSLNKHTKKTAEIHVMGVLEKYHRQKVGKRLVEAAEKYLVQKEFEFLSVKTLSESRPNQEYDRTRNFYLAMGFVPLEEFKSLWGDHNPCLFLIKPLAKIGQLHHIELYVSDLGKSTEFWSWFLQRLGYFEYQNWEQGRSYRKGETYVVFVQTEQKYQNIPYHRCQTGLNHLAFHAFSTEMVDQITQELKEKGISILYADKHPRAGGSYAVYFEDPDRIKVELVAP